VAVGSLLAVWGIVDVVPLAAVLGPPLALVSMLPLLRPVVGRRIATAVASVGTLVWCSGVFTFLTRITDRSQVPVFVVQGIVMVAAAVGLATALDRIWKAVLEALTRTGTGLAGRLGLAYPLDRLFRTSMLLAMYALIVFTLTFLAVYAKIFGDQADSLTRQVAAGAQLQADSNPSDPVSAAELGRTPGVDGVATLWRSAPRFSASFHPEAATWPVTGFDADLLRGGTPALSERAPEYATDRSVFEALLRHPNFIVVDEQFLEGIRPSTAMDRKVVVGDVVTGTDPTTGRTESFRVVGLVDRDVNETGAWASRASLQRLVGSAAVPSRSYLRVADDEDPAVVASRLSSDLVDRGVEVRTFRSLVDDQIGIEIGFFRLIQSYLAIGLVVGIAGLAVVMVRAARERRRQIGMLRAIGFPSDTVRHAFLVEASFISLQGIATGVGLGLLVSYQMLSRTASLGGDPLPFAVPWTTIAALAVIPFAASLAVALIPASQAVSLNPAEVLRLPD
jgi:putative ABC transport system permease protein